MQVHRLLQINNGVFIKLTGRKCLRYTLNEILPTGRYEEALRIKFNTSLK